MQDIVHLQPLPDRQQDGDAGQRYLTAISQLATLRLDSSGPNSVFQHVARIIAESFNVRLIPIVKIIHAQSCNIPML